jgi:hypothetical protein
VTDPIARMAQFLAGHVEWIRHRQEADEFLGAVDACLRVVRGLARGPSEQKYLGPCGVVYEFPDPEVLDETCDGDVYAYRGAKVGRCRTCGAEVATSEREAWLDAEVRAHAFRDRQIADALNISVKTIRSWATARPESRNAAGKVTRSAAPARLIAHAYDRDGKPLYLMGAVADLAEVEALRRHDRHQKRVDA